MRAEECKNFEGCDVPLCPMDESSLIHGIWFPDEDICKSRQFQSLGWIRKQKLITKRHGSVEGFFNIKMLNAVLQVHKRIMGADPDLPLSANVDERWIRDRGLLKSGGKSAMANEEMW